jgi:ABC transporter substrate binding protein
MKRREFISLLSGAAAAWPLAARAQQAAMPVIGFLASTSPTAWAPYLTAFKQGLREAGYIEGQNVTIEYRWAEGDYARLPALAADLVRRHVAVLVAVGGSSSAKAAKAASSTIPIVFTTGGDPVGLGLVASLNRPGGNVTGVALLVAERESKRFGLLRDMVPTATLVAVLLNSRSPVSTTELNDVQEAARAGKTREGRVQFLFAARVQNMNLLAHPIRKHPRWFGYIGSSTTCHPILRACPRTQARHGYRKAPYLGSMISKRRAMAARVRRSAGTVTSISSMRWISRSI